ncbi:AraC family transcriptional regulator [Pedobacter aquatilis]|uniref:helix-turn-helix domain-containing protein n=1 Tax=Pedobacter aquatilis TaxID=351343 RepID=UPI00292D199B|nr:AraC family transcriptional regulator [Pedobacter aquatilis]
MNIRISEVDTNNVVYQNVAMNNPENYDGIERNNHRFNSENYTFTRDEIFCDGVQIALNRLIAIRKSEFVLKDISGSIGFVFCLDGSLKYQNEEHFSNQALMKNEHIVFNHDLDNLLFSINGKAEYIVLRFTKDYYHNLTGANFSDDVEAFSSLNPFPEVTSILMDLFDDKINPRIEKLHLKAKIYQLLILFINKSKPKQSFSMKRDDVDKILNAKQLIEANFRIPFSLIELSRKVGINDYKLKKGFREIIGNTVFGYLYEIRMEKAYELLSKEFKSVGEVAFLVGYKNPQHFTAAFKKKFSILPGNLNKS